ncbi:putative O-glycosylation ligase, exosortase A system-associated [Undibacterium sp. Rencai35W]|uniref:putative O-glycosylation ligase, exosortase A system-associated n=1 Tax=Undibacterium sp. Rencai35W TaxID=3413046 RepID=UPI003BF0849D
MRDIFLLAILPLLVYSIFRRPFIGLGLWIWTALFNPNGWVYGMATTIRYNLLFAALTIGVFFLSKNKPKVKLTGVAGLVLLFFIWTTLSSIFCVGIAEVTWDFWGRLAKVLALFLFVLLIMEKKLHIDFFLWCMIFSVGFYAGVEGLKYVASGGAHNIEGMAGHVLGDRNELSLAMAMLLPICFYLLGEYGKKSWVLKFGLLGLIVLVVTAIIGTSSRGGMIALASVGGYLFIKSKRKLLFAFLFVCIGSAMIGLIPAEWFSRMDTISNASQDGSFMGRVIAWKLSFILAAKNPLFGGGFKALENGQIWYALSQDFDLYSFFYTGSAVPNPFLSRAAHSIYFQVLGDHGFGGLIIFVSILGLSFLNAGRVAKKTRAANGPEWLFSLATMLRLSIFAYAIGGAALSFAYFDMIYALFAIVIVLEHKILPDIIKADQQREQDAAQTAEIPPIAVSVAS